ncbi:nitroreductase family deazaflavin-dependent oxidoreductase [Iamia majanohamensis]|uniref:Nitroreductase family deazaflavin-dependent oxidoreductase n=1 Tax=Iamia majanohamensis TaxID=467976 RepID=A0AAE9Y8H4_9ACTN|nr:nitroreductase family deazaflavin-dependent oxidoreductase [Iamia majanohamensis]WCO66418.1 nitroreductase family deazaflavin-dependent oxidoreductase [Iamia majanohamensis]
MADIDDFNARIIEEFRANEGRVGGPFEGAPMILVHTVGARSGQPRVNPLVYQPLDGERVAIFASAAGADHHPAWFHNLVATPEVEVEVGTDVRTVRARVAEGDERERIWEAQKAAAPGFADYEAKTDRTIPVVVLEPT